MQQGIIEQKMVLQTVITPAYAHLIWCTQGTNGKNRTRVSTHPTGGQHARHLLWRNKE